ncbi:hypothetical protein CFK39_09740 [Brachybacterium avium]|uniref:Uncharacterized protein n=1 Tax=Brachybacterium avium TaxID=2017485 RepID=A0A220UD36_9MICO|nr:hypothetical protein CFK39_09740 [Brachybacterium avium]
MREIASSASSTEQFLDATTSVPSRHVNSLLPLGTGPGMLLAMTTSAAFRETTHRVVRSAMRSMMSMMMMPMMHRQPSL